MSVLSNTIGTLILVLLTTAPVFAPSPGRVISKPTFETIRPSPPYRSSPTDVSPLIRDKTPDLNRPRDFPEVFEESKLNKDPAQKLTAEAAKEDPDPAVLLGYAKEILQSSNLEKSRNDISRALRQAKGDFQEVSASSAWPKLTIQRPSSPAFDSVVNILKESVEFFLTGSVDRDGLVLLPLTFSNDAAAKLKELPSSRLAQKGWMTKLAEGDFEQLDYQMFAPMRGKTLVVVGHVVARGETAAFEIRRSDSQRTYLPLLALLAAAKKHQFNFIPLGCETAETLALGTATKINDLDAIFAFQQALRKQGRTPFGELLSDLSSETIHLSIDLRRLEYLSSIPIDVIDQDGRKIVPRPPSPSVLTQTNSPLTQLELNASESQEASANEPTDPLARSLWLLARAETIEFVWLCTYIFLAVLTVTLCVASISSVELIAGAHGSGIAIAYLAAGTIISYYIGYALEGWLSAPIYLPQLLGACAVALGAIFFSRRPTLEPIARYITRAFAAWIMIPAVANLLLSALHLAGFLVRTDPIILTKLA